MKTNTKEVEARATTEKKATKPERSYEALAVKWGAVILLIAFSYNGLYSFLQAVCRSDIKNIVFKVVAAVAVVLLCTVAARRK